MADTAAHLVDRVLPVVPVRQWVLSLPFALRYRMAYDSRLTSDVLNVFIRALFGELRRRAHELLGVRSSQCGVSASPHPRRPPLRAGPVSEAADDGGGDAGRRGG